MDVKVTVQTVTPRYARKMSGGRHCARCGLGMVVPSGGTKIRSFSFYHVRNFLQQGRLYRCIGSIVVSIIGRLILMALMRGCGG
jgi:hypothetical protein